MASYSPKLIEKKYNNWVKAQLAVLITKDGLEPFVCNEVHDFQLKCLNDICYANGLISGTLCSSCCTENVVKCPTNRICNVGRGKCSYHRNTATKYNPAGCPKKICNNFTTEIQNTHRYHGPSYKNTDATQWCCNPWEVAKCFMPPDGYKDIASAQDTDFNGIISVIINYKDFQLKINENLGNKNNIFEQAREIGRNLRHSPTLEVGDKDLKQYFKVFHQLLSDVGYLATDTHAKKAKQKLLDLDNDTIIIGKDDVRKVLADVAKAARDTIKEEKDGHRKQYEIIREEMIRRKQDDLHSLESKTEEGLKQIDDSFKANESKTVKQIETKIDDSFKAIESETVKQIETKIDDSFKAIESKTVKQIETKIDDSFKAIESKTVKQIETKIDDSFKAIESKTVKQIETKIDDSFKAIESKTVKQIETKIDDSLKGIESKIVEGVKIVEKEREDSVNEFDENVKMHRKKFTEECEKQLETIKEKGEKGKMNLEKVADTLEKTLYTRIKDEKEKQYTDNKKKLKDELITWYKTFQSTVPLSPLTEHYDTPLAGFYVMPDIDVVVNLRGGNKERTRIQTLQDLFASRKKDVKEIYLSADAGFGKTAFSKYLALSWCQAHKRDENYNIFKEDEIKALAGFEFLFLVILRDSAKVCNIDDMIEQQIIENLRCSSLMPKDILTDILANEKCVIVLDGLDEWTHPDNDCTRLPKTIPHRYARENCVILTTTRPWKLCMSGLKASQMDKTVELIQFNDDAGWQFKFNSIKMLKNNQEDDEVINEVCRFEDEIRDYDLEDMESTPLLLLYILCLWVEDIPFGNTKVDLYTGIIHLLLSRTEKIHGQFKPSFKASSKLVPDCLKKHTIFSSYYTFLMNLAKLASHTLFNKKKENTLVFNGSVAKKYLTQEELDLGLRSGMLTESKVQSLLHESSKVSFSHKTLQEYFSAMFISFHSTMNDQKIIFEECKCIQNILDMSKVFVFISNMNPKLMSTISSDLMTVINNDEETSKYRTSTFDDDMISDLLKDIQDMFICCVKEGQENKNLKLCLQDFFINEKCQQDNHFKQLQNLCYQNKDNIKSISIENKDICSLQEIVVSFALSEVPAIEKLYYEGEIVEEEMISLLLNPLKCLTVKSSEFVNNQFNEKYCPLSADIIKRLVQLQHLECLHIECFTMYHEVMETLLNFLTFKKSMKEIKLYNLNCSDHVTSCGGFNLDLSQHSQLRCLGLIDVPVSQLDINVSLLEVCVVGELYNPGVVSSYLSQISAASKLQLFMCGYLKSSSDIDKMLQTLPSLLHVKHVMLFIMNLGKRSLTLSPQMINIEHVRLYDITMSCSVLYDLITVVNKLPHTVTVDIRDCDIKPETEFENFKTFVKQSDNLVVNYDGITEDG